MSYAKDSRFPGARPNVLILSDDPEFARLLLARWQSEKAVPELTVATSDMWQACSSPSQDLIIAGLIREDSRAVVLSILDAARGKPVIYVTGDPSEALSLQANHPHLLVIERREEWAAHLILLSNEILRRMEALGRAHRAERSAVESQRYAALGRYMLDMRPGVNDALTSILGNADLLLLEPGQAFERTREQIQTIHRMSLRLNEIMQRFSSLATEMQTTSADLELETVSAPQSR